MDGNMCKGERKITGFFVFVFSPPTEGAKDWKQWTLDSGPTGRMQAKALQGLERGQVIQTRAGCQRQQQKLQT